jgi:hypothetical protein
MGVVQSVAQGVVDKVPLWLHEATIFEPVPWMEGWPVRLEASIRIMNNDPLGDGATTHATTASLEMPVVEGYEEHAGVFGHFTLPKMKIGKGTKFHNFTVDLSLTNLSTLKVWASAMGQEQGGIPLNIRADPVVSIVGVDPINYVVRLDKEVQCLPILPDMPPQSSELSNISMSCNYRGNAAPRPEGNCSASADCHKAMSDVCSEDGGWPCETCLALHGPHLTGSGCSTDPLELASSSNCFCHGKCGVSSHCLSHMEKICQAGKGPICNLCLTTHMADMLLIGGCGPIEALVTQACYCYGGMLADAVV